MFQKVIKSWRFYSIIFLGLLTLSIWSTYFQEPDKNFHIYILDIGQGDAILLQEGSEQLLIDGGPDNSVLEQLGKVMPVEDRFIESIILTHPHADHVTGLVSILDRYEIGEINYNGIEYESKVYESFLIKAKEKNIKIITPKIGEVKMVFSIGKITFIWPGEFANNFVDNTNNTSEIFRFDYGRFSGLFTGDAETEVWQKIKLENPNVISNITFLKVSHHGSKTGSNEENIPLVKPLIAAISLGKENNYGFPHDQTITELQKIGTDIYRTDLFGIIDIAISRDGSNWKVLKRTY